MTESTVDQLTNAAGYLNRVADRAEAYLAALDANEDPLPPWSDGDPLNDVFTSARSVVAEMRAILHGDPSGRVKLAYITALPDQIRALRRWVQEHAPEAPDAGTE